jgi:hypothetical protein
MTCKANARKPLKHRKFLHVRKKCTYRDADVLYFLRAVRCTRRNAKPLHPRVGDAIEEDDERFDKLRRDEVGIANRGAVPCPAVLRKGA